MKRFIGLFFILMSFAFTQTTFAQRSVDFVHGLNDVGAWDNTAPFLFDDFQITTNVLAYSSNFASINNIPISLNQTSTGNNRFRNNDIIIAQSMGGLLSRRAVNNGQNASALITLGTPHLGGPIIPNATANAGIVTGWWLNDLSQGWAREYGGPIGSLIASDLFNFLGGNVLQDIFNNNAGFTDPIATDMVPNSGFLNALNATPANTIAPETFFIFGAEDWYSPWRLAESGLNGNGDDAGVEYGVAAFIDILLQFVYIQQFFNNVWTANAYFSSGTFWGFILGAYYIWVAQGYWQGFISLNSWQQIDYNLFIDGAIQGNTWFTSDAFFPSISQAPNLASGANNLTFLGLPGINHGEEKNHPLVRSTLSNILEFDLNVPLK